LLAKRLTVNEERKKRFCILLIWKDKVFCLRTRAGSKLRSLGVKSRVICLIDFNFLESDLKIKSQIGTK